MCEVSSITAATQQRFRRNATDIQTHAAQRRIFLDQHRIHAQIGSAEGSGITARTATEYHHVALDIDLAL
jgi:hypothetical protein